MGTCLRRLLANATCRTYTTTMPPILHNYGVLVDDFNLLSALYPSNYIPATISMGSKQFVHALRAMPYNKRAIKLQKLS